MIEQRGSSGELVRPASGRACPYDFVDHRAGGLHHSALKDIAGLKISSPNLSRTYLEDIMNFRPLHDRVVVTRIDVNDKTPGGIIIPDTAKEKPSEGEVISVGPGGRDETGNLIPIELKAGDRVLFGKWSGTEIKLDGVDYLIMKESDIMGVIDQPVARKKAA